MRLAATSAPVLVKCLQERVAKMPVKLERGLDRMNEIPIAYTHIDSSSPAIENLTFRAFEYPS